MLAPFVSKKSEKTFAQGSVYAEKSKSEENLSRLQTASPRRYPHNHRPIAQDTYHPHAWEIDTAMRTKVLEPPRRLKMPIHPFQTGEQPSFQLLDLLLIGRIAPVGVPKQLAP